MDCNRIAKVPLFVNTNIVEKNKCAKNTQFVFVSNFKFFLNISSAEHNIKVIDSNTITNDSTIYENVYYLPQNSSQKERDFCKKQGWIYCDLEQAKDYLKNDIIGVEHLLFCLHSYNRIKSYDDDPFSFSIDNVLNVHFDQYVNESKLNKYGFSPFKYIIYLLEKYDRLMLQSLPGTGKSTLIRLLVHQGLTSPDKWQSPNLKTLNSFGINRVIMLEPTTAINSQLFKSFKENGLSVGQLDGDTKGNDIDNALACNVVFVCYDSFLKIKEDLSDTLIITDEFHQLVNDFDFRNKQAFNSITEKLRQAKKSFLLSATPNYFFALPRSINENFGYKLIKGIAATTNQIDLSVMYFKGKERDIPNYIHENRPNNKLTLIKKDDTKVLKSYYKRFNKIGLNVDYFTSKERARKEDNDNYNQVMNTGVLPDNLDYLFFTTLLEAGVSIKNDIGLMAIIDYKSWSKLDQLVSRPRYNAKDGTNKNLDVWIFKSIESAKKDIIVSKTTAQQRLKNHLNTANLLLDGQSDTAINQQSIDIDQKNLNHFVYISDDNTPKISILAILQEIHLHEKNVPFELDLKRIQRFDDRVRIKEIKTIQTNVNEDLEAIRAELKVSKEIAYQDFLKCLDDNFDKAAETVCSLSRNINFKESVRAVLDLPTFTKSDILEYAEKNKEAFFGREPKRLINDITKILENKRTLKRDKAIQIVLDNESATIQTYKNVLNTDSRANLLRVSPDSVTNASILNHARYTRIIKGINTLKNNIQKGNRSEWLKPKTLAQIINKASRSMNEDTNTKAFKPITERQAVRFIKNIYKVEDKQVRKGKKRIYTYRIGDKLSTNTDTFFNRKNEKKEKVIKLINTIKSNIKKGNKSEWLKPKTLINLISKANKSVGKNTKTVKPMTELQVIKFIKNIYKVEDKQIQKDDTVMNLYRIGDKLSTNTDTFF